MKKFSYIFFLSIFILLFFTSCESHPNMKELLSYQNQKAELALRITEGERSFLVNLKLNGEEMTFTFADQDREGVQYRQMREEIKILYEDMEIPMKDTHFLKCKEWFSLFRLSEEDAIWKIKKESLSGIDVFCCHNGFVTVYIDSASRLPFKFKTNTIEIDVISFKNCI